MKKTVWILLIALLIVGCGQEKPSVAEAPALQTDVDPTDTPTPFPTLPPEEQAEAVVEALESTYKEAFGKNYSLIAKDNEVILTLWNDKITKKGVKLVDYKGWDELRDSAVSVCEGILDTADNLECYEVSATVNYCDSSQLNDKMLTVENGIVIYDFAEDQS